MVDIFLILRQTKITLFISRLISQREMQYMIRWWWSRLYLKVGVLGKSKSFWKHLITFGIFREHVHLLHFLISTFHILEKTRPLPLRFAATVASPDLRLCKPKFVLSNSIFPISDRRIPLTVK